MNRNLLALFFLIGILSPLSAQTADKWETPGQFKSLKYRNVGPAAGGRVSRVAGVPGDPLTYYAATASGGVWKSTDGGLSFQSIFDDQPISSIGSIAVAPSDPNVIYVGSGEANIRGNVATGNGIYKSYDAGKTWSQVWKSIGQIGTMVVHPTNADIAFAAVLGSPFGPGKERGVFRTTDGGKTWQQVLFKDVETGASDVALDPNNPRILFAGLWQTRRKPWDMISGGPGSGLHVSRDGGDTWKKFDAGKAGLPEGFWGKIGVAVAPSNSQRIYALIEANEGGLFRSDNGGDSWKRVCEHHSIRQRAWYYSTLTIDPTNADVVWCPQVPMLRSIDGGKTFQRIRGAHHGDHHDIWIDPKNPKRMIEGNDGGVDITTNGSTWNAPPLPISQFYHVNVDNSVPYRVMGNMQDLGTANGPGNSLAGSGNSLSEWYIVGGGETGFSVPDPSDPNVVFAGEYGGILTRYDHRTRQARNVSAWPANPSGITPAEMKYRFQWTAPVAFSPHDAKILYHAAQVLFRTRDGGQTWETISGDLTRNDKNKQQWSGGPITGDNTGVEIFGTIFAIAESPRQKGVIWVGSDDGLVHVSQDDGKTWTNVTSGMANFPDWGTVVCIEASPFDAGTAYVVAEAHRLDDFKPYLWKTSDFGKTWQSLTAKLPLDVYLHAVREDPKRKGLLFAGTERGVSYSTDDGATWQPLKLNLPTVAVHDLQVKNDDLVVGTLGRSIWILDDIAPLREWTPSLADKPAHLFAIEPALRWRLGGGFHHTGRGAGENPPFGAVIDYYFAKKLAKPATLEIRDAQDQLIVTFTAKEDKDKDEDEDEADGGDFKEPKFLIANDPGVVNRFVWNLSYPGTEFIPKAKVDTGDPTAGPLVPPGEYNVRLTLDGQTQTQKLLVRPDPRSAGDYGPLHQFVMQVRGDFTKLVTTVQKVRGIRKQLRDRNELIGGDAKFEAIRKASTELIVKCDALEEKLHNPKAQVAYDIFGPRGGAKLYSQYAFLFEFVKDSDGPPTQGMREVYTELAAELEKLIAEFQTLVDGDLARLNEQAKSLELPIVIVPPVKPASGKAGVGSKRWSPGGTAKDD